LANESIPMMSASERRELLERTQVSSTVANNSMSDNNEAPVKLSLPLVWLEYAEMMMIALTRI
jgi:hypothetical protein